jgi:hypothetical protein
MIHHSKTLEGIHIQGHDGKIGRIENFYFDDESWKLRYVVVNLRGWFKKRRILISPAALTGLSASEKHIFANLTKDQIHKNPDVDDHRPLSRHMEQDLHSHYGWPEYWAAAVSSGVVYGGIPPAGPMVPHENTETASHVASATESGESHLNSVNEIADYHVAATDGSVGQVDAFLIDETDWKIRYLLIDTLNLLSCKKVLISPAFTSTISRKDETILLKLTRGEIERIPRYNPESAIRIVPQT